MKKQLVSIFTLILVFSNVYGQDICPIIPLPNQFSKVSGSFILGNNTAVCSIEPSFEPVADFFQAELLKRRNVTIPVTKDKNSATILLEKPIKAMRNGAYQLQITPDLIRITATDPEGAFHGIISVLQLVCLSPGSPGSTKIDCWQITDYPIYDWRGILLDESRNFFGKKTVKLIIDWMAFYKLNKFHWHLTDAPGWRIEIKKYPELTLVGGIGNYDNRFAPAAYYTQEDIKEIVVYAKERFVDIIPEIDMPGHAAAANRAYPEFSGGGSEKHPDFTFNPGQEKVYQYLTDIIRETDALFPSQMIHLGGDEVSFGNEKWSVDTAIKKLMVRNKLKDLKAVENYFIARMADSLTRLNNKVLLWDEAAETSLPAKNTIIFWWRHDKPEQLKTALDKGYKTVLCPRLPFYFDFVQDSLHKIGRKWRGQYNSISNLYNFTIDGLTSNAIESDLIIGVEAALWTERISSQNKLEFMLFPRICALAEIAWTEKKSRALTIFMDRLKDEMNLFRKAGLYYYDPFFPKNMPEPIVAERESALD